MKELTLDRGTGLVLVAHPDDETIWMGGTILCNPQIQWTIFSLCRREDPNRAPKFRRVCEWYGAKSIISNLEDEGIIKILKSIPTIVESIKNLLSVKRFTYIFTHAKDGEYGHIRHRGVHRAVTHLAQSNTLKAEKVFFFSYNYDVSKNIARPNMKATYKKILPQSVFHAKQRIVHELYKFPENSFEYRSCCSLETFDSFIL